MPAPQRAASTESNVDLLQPAPLETLLATVQRITIGGRDKETEPDATVPSESEPDVTNRRRALDAVGSVASDGLLSAAEQSISTFAEASQAITKALDIVQQAHPFISAVVLAFKAAIELEVTRRENDKKILVLKSRMMDAMAVLLELKDMDSSAVESRLRLILQAMAKDIRDCSALCEKYMQKRFIVRLFDGARWESRLAGFDAVFAQRRQELAFALAVRTAKRIDVAGDAASALLLFRQLESPLERELLKFISDHGGPRACAENEELFKQLQARIAEVPHAPVVSPGADDTRAVMAAIQVELQSDINHVLAEDRQNFNLKFDAVQHSLEEMNAEVHHNGDRIISAMQSGPHDRLLDQDMHRLWKDMAWRGSIRASQFIVGIQDYYRTKAAYTDSLYPLTDQSFFPGSSPGQTPHEMQDSWAIEFVTISRWRPILEAFDYDTTGWISVHNVNEFTSSRPPHYSVLKWIVYWSVAFRAVSRRYAHEIELLRSQMCRAAATVLPWNRARVQKYIASPRLALVDYLVRAILDQDAENTPSVLERFADVTHSEERRLHDNLERFQWNIDASNTLALITGSGPIERHILPLLRLLLGRHMQMIQLARDYPLKDLELYTAERSVDAVVESICNRLVTLIAHFQVQNLDLRHEFTHAYNGMFSVLYAWYRKDVIDDYEYPNRESAPQALSSEVEANLDILNYGVESTTVPEDFFKGSRGDTLSGSWVGQYVSRDESRHGWMAFHVRVDEQSVTGTGLDSRGAYELRGLVHISESSIRLSWKKTYTMPRYRAVWRYDGEVGTDAAGRMTSIHGHWGAWSPDTWSHAIAPLGSFSFYRADFNQRPMGLTITSTARDRWHLVRLCVMDMARKRWSWFALRQRRGDRLAAVNAYKRIFSAREPQRYPVVRKDELDPWAILRDLHQRVRPQDAAFYRWLAERQLQHNYFHTHVTCARCRLELTSARFRCLDCDETTSGSTVDLCSGCVDDVIVERGLHHLPSHATMKSSRILPLRDVVRVTNHAKRQLHLLREYLASAEGPLIPEELPLVNGTVLPLPRVLPKINCYACDCILDQALWYCVECPTQTFICDTCEESVTLSADELLKPQAGISSLSDPFKRKHDWSHILIKLSVLEQEDLPSQISQTEAHVVAMLAQLTAQQATNAAHLERLNMSIVNLRASADATSQYVRYLYSLHFVMIVMLVYLAWFM